MAIISSLLARTNCECGAPPRGRRSKPRRRRQENECCPEMVEARGRRPYRQVGTLLLRVPYFRGRRGRGAAWTSSPGIRGESQTAAPFLRTKLRLGGSRRGRANCPTPVSTPPPPSYRGTRRSGVPTRLKGGSAPSSHRASNPNSIVAMSIQRLRRFFYAQLPPTPRRKDSATFSVTFSRERLRKGVTLQTQLNPHSKPNQMP